MTKKTERKNQEEEQDTRNFIMRVTIDSDIDKWLKSQDNATKSIKDMIKGTINVFGYKDYLTSTSIEFFQRSFSNEQNLETDDEIKAKTVRVNTLVKKQQEPKAQKEIESQRTTPHVNEKKDSESEPEHDSDSGSDYDYDQLWSDKGLS
ncbi:hypothetical protein [Lactobacillus sp.]|uniref:hypothetical protein n=1 Tax=Lactobacillus sp. TaxID=1591 RepID=UPI0019CCAA23|nr:hypothetical protein [Lactobacillus sp.]MBD5430488.1 hypothetical protein [Lactobacillus sp.]MBD5430782.1 hypothetical protein [Lactobacillus sp.]